MPPDILSVLSCDALFLVFDISKEFYVHLSTPIQTEPVAHPTSYTMGTGLLPRRGFDHPSSSITEVKERVELCHSSSGPSWRLIG